MTYRIENKTQQQEPPKHRATGTSTYPFITLLYTDIAAQTIGTSLGADDKLKMDTDAQIPAALVARILHVEDARINDLQPQCALHRVMGPSELDGRVRGDVLEPFFQMMRYSIMEIGVLDVECEWTLGGRYRGQR